VKAVVVVMTKSEVLDPQGQAIQRAAGTMGYTAVQDVRQGKRFEITLEDGLDGNAARAQLAELAEKLLSNPVIEDFRIESIES
jgi:phosphoribosylformylglycinamidine synthase